MCDKLYMCQHNAIVLKRDGITEEPFDQGKIERNLKKIFLRSKDLKEEELEGYIISIANAVTAKLIEAYKDKPIPTYMVQEMLEKELMLFRLYRSLKLCITFNYAKLIGKVFD